MLSRLTKAHALVSCLIVALASACSDAQSARITLDVDTAGCPDTCIDGAQLSIGRDGCLLTKYAATGASGEQSLAAAAIRPGDVLTIGLVLHCAGDDCAKCVATRDNITARDQMVVTLQPRPAAGCVARGELPAVAGLGPCNVSDSGPPDTPPPPPSDTSVDRPAVLPDLLPPLPDGGSRDKTCSQVRDCALECTDTQCVSACAADGCIAAIGPITALLACGAVPCLGCLGNKSACVSCLMKNCPSQYAVCTNNRCP